MKPTVAVIIVISIIMISHEYFGDEALLARFRLSCLTVHSDPIFYLSLVSVALYVIVNLNVYFSVFCRYDEFIVVVL
jgi:hypothetical protein